VAAARLAVAAYQRLLVGLEEDDLHRVAALAQRDQRVQQVTEVFPSRTSTPSATRSRRSLARATRSAKVGISVVGRLSTQKKPMSSKHLIA